jgi:hypothetical protein
MATHLDIAVAPLLPPAPLRLAETQRLPDVLRDNLDVIFVGTAAGRRSAATGVYYAHPGNYFWRTLWQVGLTPRRFAPRDFAKLRDVGIGFTDLSKSGCGMDHEIRSDQFDVAAFEAKMRRHQPRAEPVATPAHRSHRLRAAEAPAGRLLRSVRAPLAVVGGAALLEARAVARSRRLAARHQALALLTRVPLTGKEPWTLRGSSWS